MRLRHVVIGSLISLAMIPYFNGCNRDLSPLNTAVSSFAPPPTPVPVTAYIYDNFENGLDFGPGWCCPPPGCWGWPCAAKIEWSTDYAVSGARSWAIKNIHNNNPGDNWSAWASLDGCLMTPLKTNFAGANYVKVYMRSSAPITVRFHWYELGTAPSGSDGWQIEATVPGGTGPYGGWTHYSWPISSFTTGCPPGGDGIPNPDAVGGLWVDFVTEPVACGPSATMSWTGYANLYIDDVEFSPVP